MSLGRRTAAIAAWMAVALSMPAPASASAGAPVDWTQFRFDRGHTGVNPFETTLSASTVPFLTPAWQAQLGRLVDSSSPAVVDGVVYIGSTDGTLWAYPAAGCGQTLCSTPLWRSTSLAQIIDSPTVANGLVYVGSQTSPSSNDGKLDVFDASGCGQPVCAPLWQGLAGKQSILQSSPAVGRGTVFVGAFDGRLYAFPARGCGAATCPPLWTGATGGTIESTPTVAGSTVLIGSDDGNLYAFPTAGCGAATCPPLWRGHIGSPVYDSTPAVSGTTVFVGSSNALAAFPTEGCGSAICQPLWLGESHGDFFGGSPAVYRGRVYIGVESEVGVFAAAGCGAAVCGPLWVDFGSGAQASILSSPTAANGVIYAGRNTAEVLAWRARPCGQPVCNQIWKGLTGDSIVSSSPAVVNGTVYVGSADALFPEDSQGRIYVFDLGSARG